MERGVRGIGWRRRPLTCHNRRCDSGGLAASRRAITDRAEPRSNHRISGTNPYRLALSVGLCRWRRRRLNN